MSRPRLRDDLARGWRAGLLASLGFAAVELVASLIATPAPFRVMPTIRFVAIDLTLAAIFAVLLAPVTALALAAVRAGLGVAAPRLAAYPVLGDPRPDAPSPAAPWVWGVAFGALLYVSGSAALTLTLSRRFKEPVLLAIVLALVQLAVVVVAALAASGVAAGARALGTRLEPSLHAYNPFARVGAALAGLVLVLGAPIPFLLKALPQARGVMPWRELLAAVTVVASITLAARWIGRRGGRTLPPGTRGRNLALGVTVVLAALVPWTLFSIGANQEAKTLVDASPPLSRVAGLVRTLNDFDRDGYGSLLGENDCAPFDRKVHPGARDLPDNGIDENCTGRDFSAKALAAAQGEKLPIPPEMKRPWNFLLITIDTVRYDHTGFGGYKQKKGRDTTPRLDKFVSDSISFNFANAPSAGTMASVPAILTSRFFHSGIALDEKRAPGMPPKLKPENTTLPEIMKRGGYKTGAILSHEYFNDWGMQQGVDTYDNALGAKPDAFRITSQDLTDKAQAWIAHQGNAKWFLWCHYIDPHGRYVAHPGEVQFGPEEEDLYDGEIAYTDKHLGRLFDWLSRSPAGGRTIVIITSDHGDGFKEHGLINHGMALFKELLHVPLIVHIPDAEPHTVDGPVSPLDIVPTIADLAGIDISDLTLEGRSLVPQLFYARDAKDRVVFSETNYPDPQRAAISQQYKLILNLKTNSYQLFDLAKDPWEKKNVWDKDKAGSATMKEHLDGWLDRVFYSRDANTNQAQAVREKLLRPTRPTPTKPVPALFGGMTELIGWTPPAGPIAPGGSAVIELAFAARGPAPAAYRLDVEATAPTATPPITPATTRVEVQVGDNTFPPNRWRGGEFVVVPATLRIPQSWPKGTKVTLTLRLVDEKRVFAPVTEATADAIGKVTLGELVLAPN